MVKTVDDATFDAEVLASGSPVLVEFGGWSNFVPQYRHTFASAFTFSAQAGQVFIGVRAK